VKRTVDAVTARSLLVRRAFSIVLTVLAAGYLSLGFVRLVADVPGSYPIDLRLRSIEHGLLAQGLNPQLYGHPGVPASHAKMVDQGGSYPPWAYAIGFVLVPPLPFDAVRWYFAALCVVALAVMGVWAARQAGWLGAAGALAIFPAAICVSYGQYGVIVTALLAAGVSLIVAERPIWGGALLGAAMLKPQLAALIVLTVFLQGHYRAIASAIVVVIAASVATGIAVGAAPWRMLSNVGAEARLYYWLSHNPLLPWLTNTIGFQAAVMLLAVAGIALTVLVRLVQGDRPQLWHAVAAAVVITMFWSYRKHYDTVLMAVFLVPLLAAALRTSRPGLLVATLLVGVSLWLPIRDAQWDWRVVQVGDLVLWPAAAWLLLRSDAHNGASEPTGSAAHVG
jgi:hypothetical protein